MSTDVAGQPSDGPIDKQPDEVSVEKETVVSRPVRKTRSRIIQVVISALLIIAVILLWRYFAGRNEKTTAQQQRTQVVPVEVAAVTQMDVPIQVKGIGNVEALSTVSVRSQVTGTLQAIYFTPGQVVRKNALLFKIDPRPLQATLNEEQANLIKAQAAVKQAQAVVARDQATANNSRLFAQREAKLVEAGVISSQDYDNAASKAQSDEAVVKADQESVNNFQSAVKAQQAVVENAKVQLGYTDIRAPIDGKTGNLDITVGNLIQPGQTTPMVTITQTSPIYVTFSIPEQELALIRKYQGSSDLTVQATIPGDDNPALGKLSLVDNTVDPTTGTIKMKATFLNGDGRLFPGQYVNVVLTLGVERGATAVPSQAVQVGQDSQFVYVVKQDMTAEVRKVKAGDTLDNMTVIEEGLQPGEKVVTDGQLALTPGAKVQIGSGQGGQGGGRGGRGGNGGGSGRGQAGPGNQGNPNNPATGNPNGQGAGNPSGQGSTGGQETQGTQGGRGGPSSGTSGGPTGGSTGGSTGGPASGSSGTGGTGGTSGTGGPR